MVANTGVAPVRTAATRHRPRNQPSRGSFTTSSGLTWKWLSSQSAVAIRSGSRVAIRPVSNHASGRESLTWTSASLSSRSWWSTTQRGSPNPFGLVSSAVTSGWGTCSPMIRISPAMVLVPLRPAPATNRTLRGYVVASVRLSSLLGCSGAVVTGRKPIRQ